MRASDIKPHSEIAVATLWKSGGGFSFYATGDAASELEPFGEVMRIKGDLWSFTLDTRFNLSDIISFVENYGGK